MMNLRIDPNDPNLPPAIKDAIARDQRAKQRKGRRPTQDDPVYSAPCAHESNTEAQLQARIVKTLRGMGYTVLETGFNRRRAICPSCHTDVTANVAGQNAVGLPDLVIRKSADDRGQGGWPRAVAILLELKKPDGALSEKQYRLAVAGASVVAWSYEEAIALVEDAAARLDNE